MSESKQTPPDMNNLNIKDLMILKMFLEKATRSQLFLPTEEHTVAIVRTKLDNIIQTAMAQHK